MTAFCNWIRKRVVGEIDQSDSASGQVTLIQTSLGKRRVIVTPWPEGGHPGISTNFWFPPNTPDWLPEVIRAQDAGRHVTVLFYVSEDSEMNIITDVYVWAEQVPRY